MTDAEQIAAFLAKKGATRIATDDAIREAIREATNEATDDATDGANGVEHVRNGLGAQPA